MTWKMGWMMPIDDQNPALKKLSDAFCKEAFGQTIQEANDKGRCISRRRGDAE